MLIQDNHPQLPILFLIRHERTKALGLSDASSNVAARAFWSGVWVSWSLSFASFARPFSSQFAMPADSVFRISSAIFPKCCSWVGVFNDSTTNLLSQASVSESR